jgi:hypothetical protein
MLAEDNKVHYHKPLKMAKSERPSGYQIHSCISEFIIPLHLGTLELFIMLPMTSCPSHMHLCIENRSKGKANPAP